jgi:hypothetical protein
LKAAFAKAGRKQPIDLIFSDTCLNGMVEVTEQFKRYAHCIVASEDLEPGDGWEYQQWLAATSSKPQKTPADWASQAVEAFKLGYNGRTDEYPCTLGAFRTASTIVGQFRKVVDAARKLGRSGFDTLDRARRDSQSFANRDTYDLRDFAVKLAAAAGSNQALKKSAVGLAKAFDVARVNAVALGNTVKAAQGLAFWFPTTRYAYSSTAETYSRLDFSKSTGWGAYLGEHLG